MRSGPLRAGMGGSAGAPAGAGPRGGGVHAASSASGAARRESADAAVIP